MKTTALFRELAPDYGPNNDPWGHAMGAFFAVCDWLTFEANEDVPAEWRFRPSPFGAARDGYEWETLAELQPDPADVLRLGWFLHRLTGRLDRAGRSY